MPDLPADLRRDTGDEMPDDDLLAAQFERHRARLQAVAQRMLGSAAEAEDAVQEAWLRLARSDSDSIDNLGGWLTTVVARICLNHLQARRARPEDPWDDAPPVPPSSAVAAVPPARAADPEEEAVLADSVGLALLVVLDTLTPPERLAFVLHDLFGMPFEEIAPIVGKSSAAARQLASRARRRVRGAGGVDPEAEAGAARRDEVVRAFLAASREGDFAGLLALLAPDAVVRTDAVTAAMSAEAPTDVNGADAVARFFSGRARAVRMALLDGAPGAVWMHRGEVRVAFRFALDGDRVAVIDLIGDRAVLDGLDVDLLAARDAAD